MARLKGCKARADQLDRREKLRPLRVRGNMGACRAPGCDLSATDLSLCNTHRTQERKGNELSDIRPRVRYRLPISQAWARDEQGRKQCLQCKKWLPATADNFHKRSQAKDNLQSRCKTCLTKARATWISKDAVLRRQYGIGKAEYEEILQRQGGVCAGCGRTPGEAGSPYLSIDRDHTCCPDVGKSDGCCVRGVLCGACNTTLGLVADNVTTMKNLIAYLESSTRHARRDVAVE